MKWTKEEVEYMKEFYKSTKISVLKEKLYRSKIAIELKARKLGLRKEAFVRRNSKLEILLDSSPITMYWIGFLAADGYFQHKRNRLKLTLSEKDILHLQKFANYIFTDITKWKNKIGGKYVEIHIQDPDIIPKIINKYKFPGRKTYNPVILTDYSKNDLLYFLIGFFDGDGTIAQGNGVITSHKSWLDNLRLLHKNITIHSTHVPYILKNNNQAYMLLNKPTMWFLKTEALKYNLPIMERKWNLVHPPKMKEKRISIDGTTFNSIKSASNFYNITHSSVCSRLKSKLYPEWVRI